MSDKLAGQLKNFRPEYFGARPNVLLILWSPVTTNATTGAIPPPASMNEIHVFNHTAMATQFQVRIAGEEKIYAAQAAQAAFALTDDLESRLSRFRANSDIARIARLVPGEKLRLGEPVFACLEIAKKWRLPRAAHFL